jgi:hypothetical protein
MQPDETLTAAYPRKYVEHIVIGLEDPLNQHLVKLAGFDFPPEQRRLFRQEVRGWLSNIERLRMEPNNRPGPFRFYYELLYDYPFGGVEVENMRVMMAFIAEEYDSPVAWLRDFHTRLAQRLAAGQTAFDLVPE